MKRKLKQCDLASLASKMKVVEPDYLDGFLGCGSGSASDPYTCWEFLEKDFSNWEGGYVSGIIEEKGELYYVGGTAMLYIAKENRYMGATQPAKVYTYVSGSEVTTGQGLDFNAVDQSNGGTKVDMKKALEYLTNHANDSSGGYCARNVMNALQAGGYWGTRVGSAHQLNDGYLQGAGFNRVSKVDYQPQAGDIIVIEAIPGHQHGHTAMYNGKDWVSDFVQKDMFGGRDFRKEGVKYEIYRKQ